MASLNNQVYMKALAFLRELEFANKAQLKDALQGFSDMSKDMARSPWMRVRYKKFATLLRAELKGYAKNPVDFPKMSKSDWLALDNARDIQTRQFEIEKTNARIDQYGDSKSERDYIKKLKSEIRMLQRKKNPKLRQKGNTSVTLGPGKEIVVRLHDTDIVKVLADGDVQLNSGGWLTPTTKRRMNEASDELNLGFNVYSKKGKWFVESYEVGIIPFSDNMIFPAVRLKNPRYKKKTVAQKRAYAAMMNAKAQGVRARRKKSIRKETFSIWKVENKRTTGLSTSLVFSTKAGAQKYCRENLNPRKSYAIVSSRLSSVGVNKLLAGKV